MIKLEESQIAQILPECLARKAEVRALSYALQRSVERIVGFCRDIGVFSSTDTAPEYVLDMLALDLGTQYYDDSLPIETKRMLVRNTLAWYMGAGTPASVEELVVATFGQGKVKEWFEYGGEPYFFKVIVDADKVDKNNMGEFARMISEVKNARSHMEGLGMISCIDGSMLNHIYLARIRFYMKAPFHPYRLYNGNMRYDGGASYDVKRIYRLGSRMRMRCRAVMAEEGIDNLAIETRRNVQYYDGKKRYDGMTEYNAMIRKDVVV